MNAFNLKAFLQFTEQTQNICFFPAITCELKSFLVEAQ